MKLYWYKGQMIMPLETGGYVWSEETCRGDEISPIYKTIEDTRNAIRKYLGGTHKREPRIIGHYVWKMCDRDWTPEYFKGEANE